MSGVKVTKEELLAIYCAGGRNSGVKSRALPQEAYQDPAKYVKFESEKSIKSRKKGKR